MYCCMKLVALITIFCLLCIASSYIEASRPKSDLGKPCTYFGGGRISEAANNLINCSWYATNACCKRTEVTSVFGSMYPLFGATKACANHINYLMCYFCSPEQYKWFLQKAYICRDYCSSVYEHCKSAYFDRILIGDAYKNGKEFCLGQKFEVVDGKSGCFDFDPDVFGKSSRIQPSLFIFAYTALLVIIHYGVHLCTR